MGDKREYGTGTLYIGKDGCWWARWRTRDDRRPHRKLGPARTPGRREGLTKKEAEAKLRELMLADNGGERSRDKAAPTVREMGDALIARMRRDDLKKSHIETAQGISASTSTPARRHARLRVTMRSSLCVTLYA